jgi:hypothetical protein
MTPVFASILLLSLVLVGIVAFVELGIRRNLN